MAFFSLKTHLRKKLSRSIFKKESRYGYLSVVGILCIVIIFSIGLKYPFIQEQLNAVFLEITSPMVKGFYTLSEETSSISENFRNKKYLREEKKSLKNIIDKLSLENATLKRLLLTYKDAESLLSIKPPSTSPSATVSVLNAFPSSSGKHIILDGGKKLGIKKNGYVLNQHGLVGKIESLSKHYAKVQLFTDASSRIPVKTQKTKHHAILCGHNNSFPTLNFVLDNGTSGYSLKPGDKIFTSGEGGIFAPNIFIGTIFPCKHGWCVKHFPLNQSSYVMVFKPIMRKGVEETF